MGVSLTKPEYTRAHKWAMLGTFLLFVLFTLSGVASGGFWGAVSAIIAFAFLIGFPIELWNVLLPISDRAFDAFVNERKFDRLLRRFRIRVPNRSEYFLVRPGFPKSSTSRVWQTVSIVFLASSILTPSLPFPHNPLSESSTFLTVALGTLTLGVPLIVGVLWVYEDAGLRRFNPKSNTISKIGTPLEQFFVGIGFVNAFVRFVFSFITGGPEEAAGVVLALLLLLLPICAFVTVMFHIEHHSDVVKKFLDSRV